MLNSVLLSLALWMISAPADGGFEQRKGYDTVLINRINTEIGTTRLPMAMGHPIEPGVFVTLSMRSAAIFDHAISELDAGVLADKTLSKVCMGRCSAAFYSAFRRSWLQLSNESAAIDVELPTRILFATDAQLPAATLIDAAYAASASHPVQPPISYLVLNAGRAGLRTRPFYLLPPRGLKNAEASQFLGLRVHVGHHGAFRISAIDPRFPANNRGTGPEQLRSMLADIKRRYPGKQTVIVEASAGTTVGDVVAVMAVAEKDFPKVVLAAAP